MYTFSLTLERPPSLPQVWGEDSHVWNPDRFFRIDVGKQTNVGMFANL